jgi:murein peptide amidase A
VLADAPPAHVERVPARIGRSVEGRPIGVWRVGDPDAARRVLVVGCIHGDEPAGRAIVRRLRAATPPDGVQLLLVQNLNPDGFARGTRQNAHGVDLNRNASYGRRYLGPPGSPTYAGPRAWSEPEARAIRALIRRERPAVSVWYHQPLRLIAGSGPVARRYGRLVGLPTRPLPRPGSMIGWQNARIRSGPAFVVELPPGRPAPALVRRHARAVLSVAARQPGR